MRKIYLSIYILLSFTSTQAQTWNWAVDIGRWFGTEPAFVRTNDAGDIFTAGVFTGNATVGDTTWYQDTTDSNNRAIYVARLTSNNDLVWAELIDGNNTVLWDLVVDDNNTTYVLGYYAVNLMFSDTTIGDTGTISGAFIAAFDAAGQRQWLQLIDTVANFGNFLAVDNGGDLIYATYLWNSGTLYIRKISHTNGSIIWQQTYPLTYASGEFLRLHGIVINSDNEIYVTGGVETDTIMLNNVTYSQDSMYKYMSFIAQFNDATGALENVELVNGAIIDEIDIDASDNIYLFGHFGKAIRVRQVTMPVDTCILNNCEEYFFAKLNGTANTAAWVRPFTDDQVYSGHIDVSDAGNLYYTTTVGNDSIAFDSVVLTEDTNRAFTAVIKFDTNGQALWGAKDAGGYLAGTGPLDISFSESGYLAIVGHYHSFYAQSWFGNDTLPYTWIHSHLFLATMQDNQVTGIANAADGNNLFAIYPNPGSGIFMVRLNTNTTAELRVYDVMGTNVTEPVFLTGKEEIIHLESLAKGMYFAEITIEGIKQVRRVVVQ